MADKRQTRLPKWIEDHVPEEVAGSQLFRFNVKLGNGEATAEVDILEDIDIDFDLLEQHLEQIPTQYMYWASIYSELKHQVTILETKIERRKAYLLKEIIANYRANNIKLTDKQAQQLVDADDVDREQLASAIKAENLAKAEQYRKSPEELEKLIELQFRSELKKTLPYLQLQLAIQQRNTGKMYHMVEAIRMRSEHCRSLAGFKRQDKEQAGRQT